MSDPFLGEIKVFAFSFAPRGYAFCDGAVLPIAQNAGLFALLSNRFGGDGKLNFKLPDLRGRVPLNFSSTYPLGKSDGLESVQLTVNTMPYHSHSVYGTDEDGNSFKPGNNKALATSPELDDPLYVNPISGNELRPMNNNVISVTGSGAAHVNIQPCLVLNFCIATSGTFPPRP